MSKVLLNADMGESFGIYSFGNDEGLMGIVDAANVACGFHASDFNHMRETVRLAKAHDVLVGAHVSLPDLQGFGRREMKMPREELANCLLYQVGALTAFLKSERVQLHHIKAHGVLYGMAARDPAVAHAIADTAEIYGVPTFGLPGTLHEEVFAERGIRMFAEFFPDLDYDGEGQLVIVKKAPDVSPMLVAQRTQEVLALGIPVGSARVSAETICIHSDRKNAVPVALAVAQAINEAGSRLCGV
jgi:5-oxoprolinase (ATP-hydrolysing) subunit A